MAARLGLDPRVWQLCEGINKEKKRTLCFQHSVISKTSFHALPPDEHNEKCFTFPSVQQKGIVANNRIVLLSM
jgi:hypothetical protein